MQHSLAHLLLNFDTVSVNERSRSFSENSQSHKATAVGFGLLCGPQDSAAIGDSGDKSSNVKRLAGSAVLRVTNHCTSSGVAGLLMHPGRGLDNCLQSALYNPIAAAPATACRDGEKWKRKIRWLKRIAFLVAICFVVIGEQQRFWWGREGSNRPPRRRCSQTLSL